MGEVIRSIRIIKMNAWEHLFAKKIDEVIKLALKILVALAAIVTLKTTTPKGKLSVKETLRYTGVLSL